MKGTMLISVRLGGALNTVAVPCAMSVVPCGMDAMRTTVARRKNAFWLELPRKAYLNVKPR